MSKKKSAKKTRAAAATRRKATKSRSAGSRRVAAPRKIQLKPIKVLIDRTISNLQKLQPTEATESTLKHLQMCSMTLGDICDPNTPGGCGPHMEFDFPLALTKSRG